jgi:hypothetical protein
MYDNQSLQEIKGSIYIIKIDDVSTDPNNNFIKIYFDPNKTSKIIQNNLNNFVMDNTITVMTIPKNFYRYYKTNNTSTKVYCKDFKHISCVIGMCSIINDNNVLVLKSITIKETFINNVNKHNNNIIYLNSFTYRKDTIKQNIMNIMNAMN